MQLSQLDEYLSADTWLRARKHQYL